ncbi:GNAT family N-acetyltransferase [Agromyces sp. S2-1-8]|uniref:GNAT family N-acetyltransferase n=1 Tax=Agromyces sp. S2-1-8 TaxID=2897180 RepID=UPI001E57DC7B|nr:GNAT family protein [Agromyces sp. S2-1-8]MCD5346621.1 GNAT family N-acetyltransferase [Agromyces sp. S2-1-8]
MTTSDVAWPRPAGPLELRLPTRELVEQVLVWRNRPEVTRWLLRTEVEPEAFTKTWLDGIDDPLDHSAIAVLDGEVVGTGSLWITDAMGQTHGDPAEYVRAEAGIGYGVAPHHAGRGFATEIARALIDLAVDELGAHRVTAGCYADNIASWKVMERLGMRREQHGVRDSWHAELGWIDGYTYAILADEWRERRVAERTAAN